MKFILWILICLFPLFIDAQLLDNAKVLTKGDKVPSLKFTNVLFAPFNSYQVNASSEKLILIDFWATWCTSCIAGFPKLDSLNRKFKDRLDILLVNTSKEDDKKKILKLFGQRKNPAGNSYTFPVIWDTTGKLDKMFPHKTVPTIVWIYKGKIISITESTEVSSKNIEAILRGAPNHLVQKYEIFDFDFNTPLLEGGNGGPKSLLLSQSLFTRYLPGLGGAVGFSVSSDKLTKRRILINQSLLGLYSIAYNYPSKSTNRIIIEDKQDSLFFPNSELDSSWKADHFFSYELTVPNGSKPDVLRKRMRFDLDQQFGLYSRIERRRVSCFALILNIDSSEVKKSIKSSEIQYFKKGDDGVYRMFNRPLSEFVDVVNSHSLKNSINPILLDETGYKGPVGFELNLKDIHNIQSLKGEVNKYGFDIVPVERELEMLVISRAK